MFVCSEELQFVLNRHMGVFRTALRLASVFQGEKKINERPAQYLKVSCYS